MRSLLFCFALWITLAILGIQAQPLRTYFFSIHNLGSALYELELYQGQLLAEMTKVSSLAWRYSPASGSYQLHTGVIVDSNEVWRLDRGLLDRVGILTGKAPGDHFAVDEALDDLLKEWIKVKIREADDRAEKYTKVNRDIHLDRYLMRDGLPPSTRDRAMLFKFSLRAVSSMRYTLKVAYRSAEFARAKVRQMLRPEDAAPFLFWMGDFGWIPFHTDDRAMDLLLHALGRRRYKLLLPEEALLDANGQKPAPAWTDRVGRVLLSLD
ncbi:uncharacterized protein PSFLO_00696 [Pseudozyma flocculosa]|uniref:Uncharacterized protein n=1 Tax=Pseudozyma flocculosa TaxID=84751 RepID=A0A5C3EU76_9BASI|nr:uncharacterized protein PSFLO_00696 [Pseudozyma flocculosa]